jgi:hypothetical protein
MQYIIIREDGAFVSDPHSNGTGGSYTRNLQKARVYESRESAERDRCPGNESVSTVEEQVGSSFGRRY